MSAQFDGGELNGLGSIKLVTGESPVSLLRVLKFLTTEEQIRKDLQ